MSDAGASSQLESLEAAILQRARALAEEQIAQADRARKDIHKASAEKLRLLEEREMLAAKAQAEREFRRLIQSSELERKAEIEALRWAMVEGVMGKVRGALAEIAADEARYLPVLSALLARAASSIDHDELVAEVNEADHQRLSKRWSQFARDASPDRKVALSAEPLSCTGGVRLASKDGRVRVDNTFEGRTERLQQELHTLILERLFPSATHTEPAFRG